MAPSINPLRDWRLWVLVVAACYGLGAADQFGAPRVVSGLIASFAIALAYIRGQASREPELDRMQAGYLALAVKYRDEIGRRTP